MNHYATDTTAIEIASFLRENIGKRGGDDKSRKSWTVAVQFALNDYKETKPWPRSEVLPLPNKEAPCKGKKYPFLLDFVVWRRDLGDGKEEGAWIVCESEWNISHHSVIEDFHKLMSFRAPYKLMIYDGNKSEKVALLHSEFEKTLAGFHWHIDDEIYIFLEFNKGDIARIYTCWPAKDVHLKPLD
jgi:hypothetical protein